MQKLTVLAFLNELWGSEMIYDLNCNDNGRNPTFPSGTNRAVITMTTKQLSYNVRRTGGGFKGVVLTLGLTSLYYASLCYL